MSPLFYDKIILTCKPFLLHIILSSYLISKESKEYNEINLKNFVSTFLTPYYPNEMKEVFLLESITSKVLDSIDIQVLDILQKQANISNTELGRRVNLSPPATHARIKRLETEGYINKHVAILNQEKLGFDLLCFIFISTDIHQEDKLKSLEQHLEALPEILECHCLTGEYDYLLKVANKDRRELEEFIRKLNKLGISRIQTSLALREIKHSTVLPILDH